MGKRWQRDKKKDYYYKRAKAERYRSRAAYKLKELNSKFGLIRRGDVVVDLGASPGGWMQVAREIVGDRGFVLGVDIAGIEELPFDNVQGIRGDFTTRETVEEIKSLVKEAGAVISDASPDISGVWDIDHFRSIELCTHALNVSRELLRPGGNLLVKVFQGAELEAFLREIRGDFSYVKVTKPKASRARSAEVYVVAKGFKGPPGFS